MQWRVFSTHLELHCADLPVQHEPMQRAPLSVHVRCSTFIDAASISLHRVCEAAKQHLLLQSNSTKQRQGLCYAVSPTFSAQQPLDGWQLELPALDTAGAASCDEQVASSQHVAQASHMGCRKSRAGQVAQGELVRRKRDTAL